MNVMAAWRSFCLSLQGYPQRCVLGLALNVGGVIISMSRAVFTSIFPHLSLPWYHGLRKKVKCLLIKK
jgi:hypothetical protein